MTQKLLLSVLLFLFLPPLIAHAQWISDPSMNNIICREGSNQNAPRIISDGLGGAIICWHDQRGAQNSFDIYAQRIDKDGFVRWTVNGNVVSAAWNSQSKPDIASDGAGGAIIAWTDTRDGNNDIYAQRIDANGDVLWAADGIPVIIDTTNDSDPKVVSDGKNGVIVTWNTNSGGWPPASKIYAQRIDGNGTLLWSDKVLVSGSLRFCNVPCITTDGNGGAYIAYAYYPRPEYDVYAQWIDANGVVQWQSKGLPIAAGSGDQDSPMIVADGAGNAFLGYFDWGSGSLSTLYLTVLKKTGPSSTTRMTSTSGGQSGFQIANIGIGLAGIAWEDGRGGGKKQAYVQIVDTTGSKAWAADGVLVSNRAGDHVAPFVITDGSGGVIVAWEDKTAGLLKSDIYGQRLSSAGAPLWPSAGVPICTAANGQQFPWMISDGQNGAIVTWEDYRPSFSNSEIYASRILADGSFPLMPPILAFSSKSVAFGTVAVGKTSKNSITLTNNGDAPVTISGITSSDPHFTLTPASNTIAPKDNVTADVEFLPTAKDPVNGIIVVASNSVFAPDTITVSGSGSASAMLETDRPALPFGNVEVGTTKSMALTVTNTGNDTLIISSITSSNPVFTVTIASKVLTPNASFVDTVRFSPTAAGSVSGDLTLTSNAPTSPTILPLSGTGATQVTMNIDLTDISFGDVAVGGMKDTTVTITNTGSDTLRITSFASGAPDFTVETPIMNIAPAGVETFTLRFAPGSEGPRSTVFTIASNALSSPDTINVDGVGVNDPAIAFAPPELRFSSVDLGSKEDLVLTVSNSGSLNLTVTSITSTHADFAALVTQFDVAGGGSYEDTIRFTPSTVGNLNGALIIVSNATSSPDTVLVKGTGTDVSPVHELQANPGAFTLFQNYPNPFNPSTEITFSIPGRGEVRLSVFDHLGREIAILAEGEYQAGIHTCRFDADDLVSGMYLYRLSWNGAIVERKMLLLR